ncbi:2-phospho-L-lactate guanylyltransferase [Epidermidibacterium keratini]
MLPVKRRTAAKTRLATSLGLGQQSAGELAAAFALDTLRAVSAAKLVGHCLVVTDDAEFAAHGREVGAEVVDEQEPMQQAPGFARLNAALLLGAAYAGADRPVAALTGDLPALRGTDLDAALALADGLGSAFVADRHETGTALLTAWRAGDLAPRFGRDSAAAHRAAGAVEIGRELERLRLDVDTADDLAAARALGLGPHTERLLAVSAT